MGKSRLAKGATGWDYYKKETCAGDRVFTLQAARKYDLNELQAVLDYMVSSGMLDARVNEKNAHSFRNVVKAMREKTAPPTDAEMQRLKRIFMDFQKKHPEFNEEEE